MREQFNLQNFLDGKYERVETRSGLEVFDLTYMSRAKGLNVVGVIDTYFDVDCWDTFGAFNVLNKQSDFDLFGILKDEKG